METGVKPELEHVVIPVDGPGGTGHGIIRRVAFRIFPRTPPLATERFLFRVTGGKSIYRGLSSQVGHCQLGAGGIRAMQPFW